MDSIFKLTEIRANNKEPYPNRKTYESDCGYFSTLEKAEERLREMIEINAQCEERYFKSQTADEEMDKYENEFGHDITLAFNITEYKVDAPSLLDIQSMRSYTAKGIFNDESLLDNAGIRPFEGRKQSKIRFKRGDIVEVITRTNSELVVVWDAQPTEDDYRVFLKIARERYRNLCIEKGLDYDERGIFDWDYSDDSYLVFSIKNDYMHSHPWSPYVFAPTMQVPEQLKELAKEIIEKESENYK